MNIEVHSDSEQTLEELLEIGKTEEYLLACGIEKDSADDFADACCEMDEAVRVKNLQNFFWNKIYDGEYRKIVFFVKALGQMFGVEFRTKFEYEVYLSYEAALHRSDNDAAKSIAEFCQANSIRYEM